MIRCTKLLALSLAVALAACGSTSSSGADGGTSAGLDAASSSGGSDASLPSGSDASLPEPAEFSVTLATACPFTKCGGAVLGTWDYTGLCLTEAEVVAPLQSYCSTATVSGIDAKGTGRVDFKATGFVSRKVEWSGTASITIPTACSALLGGCAGTQQALVSAGLTGTTCSGAGDCACTVPMSGKTDELDSYTVAGSTVTVDTSTYDFCIAGTTFTYQDVSTSNPEAGVATMVKR